jgi:hypothetical protein
LKHLILEGGMGGHMDHLHDNPNLTFGEMKEILAAASSGELEGTEKTDGQNLYISYNVRDGSARGSRGKGHVKMGGLDPAGLAKKFGGRGALEKTFSDALGAFEEAAGLFSPDEQNQIFGPDTNIFYNAEVQDPRATNVIEYNTRTLLIHRVGHVRYNRETDKIESIDAGRAAQVLANALEGIQRDKKFGEDYDVKIGAMRRLAGLDDDTTLKTALGQIEGLINSVGLSDNQTVGDYLISQIEQIILQTAELPEETIKLVISRILKDYYEDKVEAAKENIRIIIASAPEFEEEIRQILANYRQIVSEAIRPLERIIHDFAVEILRGLESAFVLDNKAEVVRLRAEVSKAITAIENSGSEEAMEILKIQLAKLKTIEDVSTAAEGFVFDYNGWTYKFTGNFAPANQLLGLFKYGRGNVPPLQKLDEQEEGGLSGIQTIIGIYPGRFQPMGRHHANVFRKIAEIDFVDAAYVVTSDVVKPPKSPFTFEEKKAIMVAHGIPESNIAQTRNPYRAEELLGSFDPDTTAAVFFVGAKDMEESPRFANLDGVLKDGSPSYLKTLDLDNLQPMGAHGYVAVAPHESLEVSGFGEMSGTTIRDALASADETSFEEIMGWFDEGIYNMVKAKLGTLGEEVDFVDLAKMAIDEKKKRKPYMEPNMLQDPSDIIELDDEKLEEAPVKAPTLTQIFKGQGKPGATPVEKLKHAAETPMGQMTLDTAEVGARGVAAAAGIPTSWSDVPGAALGWMGGLRGASPLLKLGSEAAGHADTAATYADRAATASDLAVGKKSAGSSMANLRSRVAAQERSTTPASKPKAPAAVSKEKTWSQTASDWWHGKQAPTKPKTRYAAAAKPSTSLPKPGQTFGGVPVRRGIGAARLEESEIIELDDKKLEEISAMAGGAVEGGALNATEGGPFPGLDVKKENEKERKRSKQVAFDFVAEQDSVIQEITNYLLVKKGHIR